MPESIQNAETVIFEEGIEVQQTKAYGIGIDCHSKFIQVSVYVKRDLKFFEYRREFATDWNSLIHAKEWCVKVLTTCSSPVLDLSDMPFHYCIESTSTYHMPVLLAWEGTPSIINPTIAGASKRKTDVLDAKMLALHDLTGIWPESYLPSVDVKELRVLISERNRFIHDATAAGSRINNIIVRFGLTVGRDGSVVKSQAVRAVIEDQISSAPSMNDELCPFGIPADIRSILRDEYHKYDLCLAQADNLMELVRRKALSMEWETSDASLPGTEMLHILTSAPQIGKVTAITWLAHIITPRRFPNAKAVAAYCGLDPSLKVSAKHVTSTVKRGGCKELHKALTSSADRLIRSHTEMFGKWGYNLYLQTGKWKKAANAVARKLATALDYMMLTGQKFSYENYSLIKDISVFDIPVSELPLLNPDFKRYIRTLQDSGIYTTSEMAAAYFSCRLGTVKGLGKKFFSLIKDFFNNQKKYKAAYNELRKGEIQNEP